MSPAESGGEPGLRDYLSVLRRRKGIILLIVLLVVVPTLVLSLLQTPVYAGRAELLLEAQRSESLFDPSTGVQLNPDRQVQNE
ncbi:MAG: Wzz/FepE/Etk N-terminal domain-containing protein, partial [Actinomycetota bacterium]|nr:Wzz/FepE/Etk N-terminal domain-containing protein [Actinomycetota bacterium]